MDRQSTIDRLKALEPRLRAAGVASLYLFGSRVRGDHRPDSDMDLLYDAMSGDIDYFEVFRVKDELATAFELPVDLVDRRNLHALVVPYVEPDLVRIF